MCVNDKFAKPIVLHRGENAAYVFIRMILEEYNDSKNVIQKTL